MTRRFMKYSAIILAVMFLGLNVPFMAACSKGVSENAVNDEGNDDMKEENKNVVLEIDGHVFRIAMDGNDSARAFVSLLPMEVEMDELNGNEMYCIMPETLPVNPVRPGTIQSGDLMLFGSDCLVLFYETFRSSYSYTRLGRLDNPDGLSSLLSGRGRITARYYVDDGSGNAGRDR